MGHGLTQESWFHAAEIFVMIVFGSPLVWSALRIASLLKDFPLHRHLNGKILYPRGYEPQEIVQRGK